MLFIAVLERATPDQPVRNWARVAGSGVLCPGERLELLEQGGKAGQPTA